MLYVSIKHLNVIVLIAQISALCDAANHIRRRSVTIPATAPMHRLDSNFISQLSAVFMDTQNYSVINFAKQGIPLTNYLSSVLMGEISLGTPEQKLTVGFDNVLPHTYVVNGEKCISDRCKLRRRFRPRHYIKFIGQFSTNQTLLLMDSFWDDNYAKYIDDKFDEASKFDGEISLAFGNKVKSPVENMLNQFDENVVSFWVDSRPISTNARITFGGKDEENCEKEWNFLPLMKTKFANLPAVELFWEVPVDKVQVFKDDVVQKELTDAQSLMLATVSVGVWGPEEIVNGLIKQVLDKNNLSKKATTVSCDTEGLPSLNFTIASKIYQLTPTEYVVPLVSGSDKCFLSLYPKKDNRWMVSLSFFRRYCIAFDYTADKRRIGFATPISNPRAALTKEWVASPSAQTMQQYRADPYTGPQNLYQPQYYQALYSGQAYHHYPKVMGTDTSVDAYSTHDSQYGLVQI
ncbi:eukaryotic aspartyl protease domain-containing protein [Ditylenchus destructor]|nr:eukaryotic aspartyl protease domain-containing protein [Ditylenchus destructor]